MRVYDTYVFPIGTKLKPADQFSQIKQYLIDQQLPYKELRVLFTPSLFGRSVADYFYKFLPELKEIPPLQIADHPCFANTDEQLQLLVPVQEETVEALLAKIPRTINPDDVVVAFSCIPFEGVCSPVLPGKFNYNEYDLPCSHIQLFYDGVFPTCRNVLLRMDVTDTSETILDSSPYAEALAKYLPRKWNAFRRKVLLSEAEEQKYASLIAEAKPLVEHIKTLMPPEESCEWPFVVSYSLAPTLKRTMKKLGFAPTGYIFGTSYFRKINKNGHGICLAADVAPSKFITAKLTLRGLGFSFRWTLPAYRPTNQEEADLWCEKLSNFLSGGIIDALDELGSRFPDTPSWFFTPLDC